jgi:hypothetical protein
LRASPLAYGFEELHVDLQLVAGALLLVALPAQRSPLVALGGGQPVHPEAFQDPPHPRGGDRDVVVAGEIHGDHGGPEVVVLAQPHDLLDYLSLGDPRRAVWPVGSILQPLECVGLVAARPAVIALPANPVIAAGRRHIAADFLDMAQHSQPALRPAFQLTFGHADLLE